MFVVLTVTHISAPKWLTVLINKNIWISNNWNIFWRLHYYCCFLVKRILGRGPGQRESEKTVLYLHIIVILITYIIIKLLIMENHPSRNQKWNFSLLSYDKHKNLMLPQMSRESTEVYHLMFQHIYLQPILFRCLWWNCTADKRWKSKVTFLMLVVLTATHILAPKRLTVLVNKNISISNNWNIFL